MFKKRRKPIPDQERKIADPARARERTMNRAVKLLAAKPRSVRELRDRLLEKPWTDAGTVDAVLDKLKGYKYLDDEQYARDVAASKLRQKPQGRLKLQQSMSRKKLDKTIVDAAINDAFEMLPEAELINTAIGKRLRLKGKPTSRDEIKKFYDHLMRQGFGYGLIREKMQELAGRDFDAPHED